MRNEAKRRAQEALFVAIQDQAQNNMKAAMRPSEKAQLLRELAEAYRLAAGSAVPPQGAASEGDPSSNGAGRRGGEESGRRGGDDSGRRGGDENSGRRPVKEAARDGATAR